ITEHSGETIWKAVRGIVTGVSSPPSITNLRGRMLAATRTPLTASGSAPGRTVLIARMVARSGEKSAALRRSETSASVTSKDTQFSYHPRKRDDPVLASVPIPKFARPCSALPRELRNQRDTSKLVTLVWFLDLKFLCEPAAYS